MKTFPPLHERPCYQRPPDRNGHHSCMLPQDECVCYQETIERDHLAKTKLLFGVAGALTAVVIAAGLWMIFR